MWNCFLSHGGCPGDGCQLPGTSDRQVEERDEGMRERADRMCVCAHVCVCVCVVSCCPQRDGERGLGWISGSHSEVRGDDAFRSAVKVICPCERMEILKICFGVDMKTSVLV